MKKVLLASASPRRKQLLQQLHYQVEQRAADIDETIRANEAATDYVMRMAKEKAAYFANDYMHLPIVAADTIIHFNGSIIGKPKNFSEACDIWSLLADQQHQVLSSVAIYYQGQLYAALNHNEVSFARLTAKQMQDYWASGEPQDKAGAYAIQGIAAQWIKQIKGSYSGIMGLPLYELQQLMLQAGIISE